MTPVVKTVGLPNQVKLPYVEQGDPSGVPVLFLHGYADSWHTFELVLPHLPESIRAFVLTQTRCVGALGIYHLEADRSN